MTTDEDDWISHFLEVAQAAGRGSQTVAEREYATKLKLFTPRFERSRARDAEGELARQLAASTALAGQKNFDAASDALDEAWTLAGNLPAAAAAPTHIEAEPVMPEPVVEPVPAKVPEVGEEATTTGPEPAIETAAGELNMPTAGEPVADEELELPIEAEPVGEPEAPAAPVADLESTLEGPAAGETSTDEIPPAVAPAEDAISEAASPDAEERSAEIVDVAPEAQSRDEAFADLEQNTEAPLSESLPAGTQSEEGTTDATAGAAVAEPSHPVDDDFSLDDLLATPDAADEKAAATRPPDAEEP